MRDRVLALLREVASGSLNAELALEKLALAPFETLPYATVDHHRALRHGFPEVILGQGKTVDQILGIAERIAERGDGLLVTRLEPDAREALGRRWSRGSCARR